MWQAFLAYHVMFFSILGEERDNGTQAVTNGHQKHHK
jgi:hypothetical protein